MLKRILMIAAGVFLGTVLSLSAVKVAAAWGFWPNRELDQSSRYVRDVLKLVNENYVDGSKAELPKLTEAALHGIVDSLDPHSEYMNARDYKMLEEEISSEFGGIGVQVELRNGSVVVIAPIAGTPGARAGILRADVIVSIEGVKLEKPALDDVVGRLRGKPGTTVKLGFLRPSTGKEFQVTLKRERIKVESVRDVRMRPDGIGYVQITQFSERTGEEFVPFDVRADYGPYVDGKPRLDGTRGFLASRGITLPDGDPADGPDEDTVVGLATRKNELVHEKITNRTVTALFGVTWKSS